MYFPPKHERTFEPDEPALEDRFKALFLGEFFSAITSLPPQKCALAFEGLRDNGIDIGNGGFVVVRVVTPLAYDPAQEDYQELTTAFEEKLEGRMKYYMFSSKGLLHVLLSFPDYSPDEEEQTMERVRDVLEEMTLDERFLAVDAAAIVSSMHIGTENIFHATDQTENRYALHKFLSDPPRLFFIETGAEELERFADCIDAYQRLANRMASRVREADFSPENAARELVECMEHACVSSTVPVQTHNHVIALTLTGTMISSGVCDAAFARDAAYRHGMLTSRNEAELMKFAAGYFEQMREQYLLVTKNIVADRMRSIKEYVEENITQYDISVSSVADRYGVNRSLLTSQFKKYYDVSLSRFIQNCRVEKAKAFMAEHPDWSMERVAEAAGYNSLSTMYRSFKKQDGVAPGSFKQIG